MDMTPEKNPQNPYRSFLVEASAGSGKTYQLSRRFLHLVAAHARPENILTVTFTKKAASEMQERILDDALRLKNDTTYQAEFAAQAELFYRQCGTSFQAPPLAPQVIGQKILTASQMLSISTIDALLMKWVSQFPIEAGLAMNLALEPWRLTTPTESSKLLAAAWEKTTQWLIKQDFFTSGLCGTLFPSGSLLKARYRSLALSRYSDFIWLNQNLGRGSALISPDLHEIKEQAELLYRLYCACESEEESLKQQSRRLSFRDINRAATRLFLNPTAAVARYLIQSPIQHLLVDEFQDTSPSQWFIFEQFAQELLAGSDRGPSSTFLVGDPKQSIYGFREADPLMMARAHRSLSSQNLQHVGLHQSYRSTRLILQFVNAVLTQQHRIDYVTHEPAQHPNGVDLCDFPSAVEIIKLEAHAATLTADEKRLQEAEKVAQKIASILQHSASYPVFDKHLKTCRPIEARDIAVLYRQGMWGPVIEEALRSYGLPVQREERGGLLNHLGARDFLWLLRWMAFPSDELAWTSFLRGPFWQASSHETTQFLGAALSPLTWLKEQASNSNVLGRAKFTLDTFFACQSLCGETLAEKLQEFLDTLGRSCPDQHLFNTALHASTHIIKHLQNTPTLAGATIHELIYVLEQQEKDDETSPPSDGEDAIKLLTIHKAKGLEWPMVFLVGCSEPWYRGDIHWLRAYQDGQPQGIVYLATKEERPKNSQELVPYLSQAEELNLDEAERLLYVTVTRARQYFLASGVTNEKKPDTVLTRLTNAISTLPEALTETLEHSHTQRCSYQPAALSTSPVLSANLSLAADYFLTVQAQAVAEIHETKTLLPSTHKNSTPLYPIHKQKIAPGQALLPQALTADDASGLGILLHRAMELYIQRRAKNWQDTIWQDTLSTAKISKRLVELCRSDLELISFCRSTIEAQVSSSFFADLLDGSQTLHTEVPFAYLDGETLVRGRLDLLARRSDGSLWLIDFKTALFKTGREEERMLQWQGQLEEYRRAIAEIYPETPLKMAIWNLTHGELCWLTMGQ